METEEVVELGLIAVIVIAVAYIIAKALGFLDASGVPGAASNLLSSATAPLGKAASTLVTGDASVPLSDSNLFYSGIDNFFNTGSIYNPGGQAGQ
jgi:hypothetical protein